MSEEETEQTKVELQASKIRRMKQRKEKLLRQIEEIERDNVYLAISLDESAEVTDSIIDEVESMRDEARQLFPDMAQDRWDEHLTFLNESLARLPEIEVSVAE